MRRSSMGVLDGMLGVSDIGAYICLMSYAMCVCVLLSGAEPALKRASKQVVILMPPIWGLFLALALWDPFGVLGSMFRF